MPDVRYLQLVIYLGTYLMYMYMYLKLFEVALLRTLKGSKSSHLGAWVSVMCSIRRDGMVR